MIDEKKLLKVIKQNSYPISHGINNQEMGMTLYGIEQAIDEQRKAEEEKGRDENETN